MDAQLENKASDVTPATTAKGLIYHKSATEPIKVSDGTTVHKVLTDQMSDAIKTLLYPSGVPVADQQANDVLAADDAASFSTTSTTAVDVTNQSVSFTATGKRVIITLVNGSVTSAGTSAPAISWFKVLRDATDLGELCLASIGATSPTVTAPGGSFVWIDEPAAGTYTYKLQARSNSVQVSTALGSVKIFVREI